MQSIRYPEIEVSGTAREMGQQIGEAAREHVRGFCEVALERVRQTVDVSGSRARAIAAESLVFAEAYRPDFVDELRGIAESAGVSLDALMLLQIRNQLQDDHDVGCTSLGVQTTVSGRRQSLLAQNWDSDPALDPFTIVLTRRPNDRPAILNVTQAGLIAYVGVDSLGVGACLNTLPAPSRSVGVPHYFTLREIYETGTLTGAVHAVDRAQRAIPANILLATPDGPADLEVTIDAVHVLRPAGCEPVTHTNHCRHQELLSINDAFPDLIDSRFRQCRIDALVQSVGETLTFDDICSFLSDHEQYPRSICRHENDDPACGFWKTVFSVIIQPEALKMHVTRGNPCEQPYETYALN
ncbi:MAG: C45 family peptidase [Planctomycetaceae bacterium]